MHPKKQEYMDHSKGGKNQQKLFLKQTCFKTIVSKMLKELKEDVKKINKIMAKQNGNIDEDNKTEKEIKKKFWS